MISIYDVNDILYVNMRGREKGANCNPAGPKNHVEQTSYCYCFCYWYWYMYCCTATVTILLLYCYCTNTNKLTVLR